MNDPIDFTLATDATGAECALCLWEKMIQKELAAQEGGGGWNWCGSAGEGRQEGCPGGGSCQGFLGSCFGQHPQQHPAPAGRVIEPLSLQVQHSCGQSDATTGLHQFV